MGTCGRLESESRQRQPKACDCNAVVPPTASEDFDLWVARRQKALTQQQETRQVHCAAQVTLPLTSSEAFDLWVARRQFPESAVPAVLQKVRTRKSELAESSKGER